MDWSFNNIADYNDAMIKIDANIINLCTVHGYNFHFTGKYNCQTITITLHKFSKYLHSHFDYYYYYHFDLHNCLSIIIYPVTFTFPRQEFVTVKLFSQQIRFFFNQSLLYFLFNNNNRFLLLIKKLKSFLFISHITLNIF